MKCTYAYIPSHGIKKVQENFKFVTTMCPLQTLPKIVIYIFHEIKFPFFHLFLPLVINYPDNNSFGRLYLKTAMQLLQTEALWESQLEQYSYRLGGNRLVSPVRPIRNFWVRWGERESAFGSQDTEDLLGVGRPDWYHNHKLLRSLTDSWRSNISIASGGRKRLHMWIELVLNFQESVEFWSNFDKVVDCFW